MGGEASAPARPFLRRDYAFATLPHRQNVRVVTRWVRRRCTAVGTIAPGRRNQRHMVMPVRIGNRKLDRNDIIKSHPIRTGSVFSGEIASDVEVEAISPGLSIRSRQERFFATGRLDWFIALPSATAPSASSRSRSICTPFPGRPSAVSNTCDVSTAASAYKSPVIPTHRYT